MWVSRMDSGVVFCRREDFEAASCVREPAKAVSSARKFDKHGDWHYLTNLFRSAYWFVRDRNALHEWGQDYWYRDRR